MQVEVNIRQVATEDVGAAAQRLEWAGVDVVADAEVRRDPLLTAACLATTTQRIHLASAISIAFARSPMVYAYAARQLQDMSQGRFHLGLGTQVRRHIERRFSAAWGSPGPRLRDTLQAIRDIWQAWETGTPLEHASEHFTIDLMTPEFDLGPNPHRPVPLEVAAVNPFNLGVAARMGDAVRLHVFSTPAFLRQRVLPRLQEATAEAGRAVTEVLVVGGGFIATGGTEAQVAQARESARKRVAFYGSTRTYWPVLELHGWEALGQELRGLADQGRWEEMAGVVPDDVLDEFVTSATYPTLAAKIRERFGGTIDRLQLPWPAPSSDGDVDWDGFARAVEAIR